MVNQSLANLVKQNYIHVYQIHGFTTMANENESRRCDNIKINDGNDFDSNLLLIENFDYQSRVDYYSE